MVDTCHYSFFKLIECATRVKLTINYGLWAIILYQFNCNKYTTLVQDGENEGGYACIGAGSI